MQRHMTYRFHLIRISDRPLEVHAESDVVVVGRELPEQTRSVLVSGYADLEIEGISCNPSRDDRRLDISLV